MARKRNRKDISILENLTKPTEEGLFSKPGIPREQITSELFLNLFATDIRLALGFYHPEDIAFIEENFTNLPKEILLKPAVISSNLSEKQQRGLFIDLRDSLREGEELELSKSFVRLFLKYYSNSENRKWLYDNYYPENASMVKFSVTSASEQINDVLSKFIEKYEDDIFELISFEKYKFDIFDQKITEEINKYLSNNPLPVNYLEKATLRGVQGIGGYIWSSDTTSPSIRKEIIAAVDPSLLEFQVDNYSKPFKFLGRGKTKVAGTNNVRLKEGSGFSNFKISNIKANPDDWFGYGSGPEVSVRRAYNEFVVEFFSTTTEIQNSNEQIEYNDEAVQNLFEEKIRLYLTTEIEFSIGSFAGGPGGTYKLELKDYIAKKLLDTFRYAAWLKFVEGLKGLSDDEALANAADIRAEAFQSGESAAEDSPFSTPTEGEGADTDEDRQARKKFLKQCMLMTRLDDLADENLTRIASLKNTFNEREFTHYKNGRFAPYRNRFYMVEDSLYTAGDQTSTVNKLVIPNGNSIREFLDMKPSTHAYLVPKLRFYKVYTDKTGNLKEFQFHFRNFTDPNRVNRLSEPNRFDRGGDYGIKEFNFSFDGTNPATAKNDIKANLSLYFQTFGDFIDKKFTDEDGDKHAFVDLLLLPSGKKKDGSGAPAIAQYDAKYYRIRADVGWEIESTRVKDLEQSLGAAGIANLRNSLRLMNKSFYLNMVDHTMDFRDDGSIQIDVEYRAYIESALKGTTMDALASPESRRALKKVRRDYEILLSKQRCSAKELNEIRLQLEQIEDLFKKHAYQSIMKRLVVNGAVKFKKIRADAQAMSFLRKGYFTTKVSFASDVEEPTNELQNTSEITKQFNTNENGFVDLKSSDDFLYLNYFYLGDLLYAIMDTLYDEDDNYHEGLEKFKFVLGSFQYEDLLDANAQAKVINLANIPISCELFFEWFTENIIKPERNSYPIMFFIRDLAKYLITEILSESCFKRSFDKTLQFKTMSFMGLSSDNKDPLGKLFNYSSNDLDVLKDAITLDVGKHYRDNNLPLPNDLGSSTSISDYYNYIAVYIDTPRQRTNKDASTTKALDEQDGIMHYKIGRDRGILKKIKFAKSDMQYIREARFFRHGHDGLMQLSAVYKVNMDMIGNTLYYPGMEVFIDPLGLVGANSDADPRQKRSIANRLGFGGYHLVTSVRSSIGPGKFTTTVEAMFSYSGDGDPSSRVIGSKIEIKDNDGRNLIDEAQDNRPQSYKDYCATIKDKVITKALNIAAHGGEYAPIDYNTLENTTAVGRATSALISQGANQDDLRILSNSDYEIDIEDLTYDPDDDTYFEVLNSGDITEFKIVNGKVEIVED